MTQLIPIRYLLSIGLKLTGLCLFIYFLFFYGLGNRELWSSHEARAAQDAQSIIEGGDWRLPHLFDGRAELQKPPLYYWLTALIGWCHGLVDEMAVRLPATMGALLTSLALLVFLWQHGNPRAGLFAALMLLTMIHFTWMGRVGRVDMPLTAATTWSIISFLLGSATVSTAPNWKQFYSGWYLLGYFSLAAGLMLKGPIAAVLVGSVVLICVLARQRLQESNQCQLRLAPLVQSLLWGLPLLALLVVPWCWWINETTQGGFVNEFLIKHNFHRGFGGDEQLDAHIHSWWFYLYRIWIDWFPWSLLLPPSLWWLWKNRKTQPEACYGLIWAGTILLLLSLLQYKRADYLLPAYPGAALFLGIVAKAWLAQSSTRMKCWSQRIGITILVCLALGWFSYIHWKLPQREPQRALAPFAKTVRTYYPSPGQIILFRIDSHHLTWELGKSTERIWEWENLSWWATRSAPVYVIMPQKYADECAEQLQAGHLTPLATTCDHLKEPHELPLVLLVNDPGLAQANLIRQKSGSYR